MPGADDHDVAFIARLGCHWQAPPFDHRTRPTAYASAAVDDNAQRASPRPESVMPDGSEPIAVKVMSRIAEIQAAEWDACAGADNPFVSHAFLKALEDSQAVGAEAGWLPQHLAIESADGHLAGVVPLYLKSHSYGEYVFDWSWADAYERAGGEYYPKLQCAVPFTPVTGPRLLVRPGAAAETEVALIAGMRELARQFEVSSLHVTFPTAAEWRRLGEAGFVLREGTQYHWENRGYASFDDFLADLNARKRKAIKRERRDATGHGLTIRVLTGDEIEPRHWDAFYRFYITTSDRKWGYPYLNRGFFHRLSAAMADKVALVVAEADGRPVAGALNLIGGDALYGRNWGCLGDYRFLHFEACYYQAIEFAIAHGLQRVEAGAQGPHKLQRGYVPVSTYSAHWFRDPGMMRAVAGFLRRERWMTAYEREAMAAQSPFRKGGGGR
jgi:predicted N-acyltransferase